MHWHVCGEHLADDDGHGRSGQTSHRCAWPSNLPPKTFSGLIRALLVTEHATLVLPLQLSMDAPLSRIPPLHRCQLKLYCFHPAGPCGLPAPYASLAAAGLVRPR
jgi:hypothetical protein